MQTVPRAQSVSAVHGVSAVPVPAGRQARPLAAGTHFWSTAQPHERKGSHEVAASLQVVAASRRNTDESAVPAASMPVGVSDDDPQATLAIAT
jgi:hypothetical protein